MQRDSASDFDLDSTTRWPRGIAFANNRFYVVDSLAAKVYAYQASGQRDSASDFDLDSANRNAEGITFANNRFYVVDDREGRVYAYDASGQRASAFDLYLDPANGDASGIEFANNRFYVVDDREDRVYAYDASGQRAIGGADGASRGGDLLLRRLRRSGVRRIRYRERPFRLLSFEVIGWSDEENLIDRRNHHLVQPGVCQQPGREAAKAAGNRSIPTPRGIKWPKQCTRTSRCRSETSARRCASLAQHFTAGWPRNSSKQPLRSRLSV